MSWTKLLADKKVVAEPSTKQELDELRVTAKAGHHYFTFQALQAADSIFTKPAIYFDTARDVRNDFSYDPTGPVSDTDTDDLHQAAEQFVTDAEAWIAANHPSLKK